MTKTRKMQAQNAKSLTIILTIIGLILLTVTVFAEPSGPSVSYISNSTSPSAGIGTNEPFIDGGYISTITLDVLQQNFGWKAYVGNLTGKLTLDDSDNYTIYDWSLTNLNAEIYISRNQTVTWSSIGCAATSVIEAEDTVLGKSGSDESINATFATKDHKQFIVAGTTISQNNCYAISTFVNDTAQGGAINDDYFQQVLLNDSSQRLVYATIAETDAQGYRNLTTFDFQAIVPDSTSVGVITPYYFFVEIGS